MIQVILEAYANLALHMSRDGQPRFTVDVLLVQVHVLLRTRVDDLNVDALVGAGADVRRNDHERVHVGRVPNAFGRRVAMRLECEFDGVCGMCEEENCE
jgi:hypothetical protein